MKFDINKATVKYQLFIAQKRFGIPKTKREPDNKVDHITDDDIRQTAEREALLMKRAYKSQTMNFGKKLRKSRGENHRAGGGRLTAKNLPKMVQGDINNVNYNDLY